MAADRAFLAWEWLRRRADYREAATAFLSGVDRSGQDCRLWPGAERWGLHRFEPPHLPCPHARPVWRHEIYPAVLEAAASDGGGPADRFDIGQLGRFQTVTCTLAGAEHVLLSDGLRGIRLDVIEGSVREGPVQLHYRLKGIERAQAPLLTLRRFLALCRHRAFSAALHPREARAGRWILMLRAYDAILSGASQRDMAAVLLSSEAYGERWRVEAPTLRLRVQRLARSARAMAGGGYLSLLEAPQACAPVQDR